MRQSWIAAGEGVRARVGFDDGGIAEDIFRMPSSVRVVSQAVWRSGERDR